MTEQPDLRSTAASAKRKIPLLLLWLLCVGGFLVFAHIADEVTEGETHRIDLFILMALRSATDPTLPMGPVWLRETARDITALGSPAVLLFFVVATIVFLLLIRQRRMAMLALASLGGGQILTLILKTAFDRPRPDVALHAVHVATASFPSGHASMAALTYFTLAALATGVLPEWRLKMYVMSLGMMLTVVVGLSRIYLGVHWPTDVAAGWAVGASWGLLCWAIARHLRRAGDGG